MRFDVVLTMAQRPGTEQPAVFAEAEQSATWAEQFGYSGIWLLEHHFTRYSLCASGITMAAFLLGRTSRIRVGTGITIVPLEHPIKLAERVAMLDHLSGGRFDFGVGRGTYARDYEAFGIDMTDNHLKLVETTEAILRAWSPEPFALSPVHDGAIEAVPVNPRPRTLPHPPTYVASTSDGTIEWAASHGFPMLIREAADDSAKRQVIKTYAAAAARTGRAVPSTGHALTCIAVLDDSDARAKEIAARHVGWWVAEGAATNGLLSRRHRLPNYQTYFDAVDAGKKAGVKDPKAIVEQMVSLNLVGTPKRCRERLVEICESTGLRHFILGFDANAPGEDTRRAMEQCMSEVLKPVERMFAE